jgi:hypothetical protein
MTKKLSVKEKLLDVVRVLENETENTNDSETALNISFQVDRLKEIAEEL